MAAADVLGKAFRIQRYGLTGKQWLVAAAAIWRIAHVRRNHTIGLMAMGADDVQGIGGSHSCKFISCNIAGDDPTHLRCQRSISQVQKQ